VAQSDTADKAQMPETVTRDGLYVRKATGLVREVSPVSGLLFNVLPAAPGVGLAVFIFFALGVFPGAHIIADYWLTGVIAVAIALPFGFLGTALARSGGDYILVSRSLGAPFGVASSISLAVAAILSVAVVATAFVEYGVIPAFQTIGLIVGSKSWLHTATTLSDKGYTLVLSLALVAGAVVLQAIRLRTSMRFQNISFLIAGLGMLAGLIVMLATTRAGFIAKFDDVAGSGAYAHIVATGHKMGIAKPGTSWKNTVPTIGIISALVIFSWWSANYGGEIRAPRPWSTILSMTVSVGIVAAVYTVMTIGLNHLVGSYFVAASSGGATSSVPPYWFVFVAIAVKSAPFAVILVVTYLFWFPIWCWLQMAQPIRAMFAWAYDGIFPRAVTKIDDRTHIPVGALAVAAALSVAATIWAVYAKSFLTVLSTTSLFNVTTIELVAFSAILLPFLKPDLWRRTPAAIRIAGIPLLSIVGVLGAAAGGFIFYLYMEYPGLGIAHPLRNILAMVGCIVLGFALYYGAAAIQRRRGIDVSLNYGELPAE
jgi:basic amino acid/polyamine antiporter, APA family